MATFGLPSASPPNQAESIPPFLVSTMVAAWHDGNGAFSKIKRWFTAAFETAQTIKAAAHKLRILIAV
jgi:hypothetical protein